MSHWETVHGGLQRRVYPSYDAYVVHQGAKLARMSPGKLQAHDQRFREALDARLQHMAWSSDLPVLCLGARTGAEVQVFHARGCWAIGLDLNPGPENVDVIRGDFHALSFADRSFGTVYTNALDHAYDVSAVLAGIRRVLMPDGVLWLEAVRGTDEGCAAGAYESLAWSTIDALLPILAAHGLPCRERIAFDCPWSGEALVCYA